MAQAQFSTLHGAERQLSALAKGGACHGLLVGLRSPSPDGASLLILITGALRSEQERPSQEEVGRLLEVVPGGFLPVGAFWTGTQEEEKRAQALLPVALSGEGPHTQAHAVLASVDGVNLDSRPQYFLAPSSPHAQPVSSSLASTAVPLVDDNRLWEAHVPMRCALPILLQIPSTSSNFPSSEELQSATDRVALDLRATTAAFLVDSAKELPCSLLVQPWDEKTRVTGRGFASGGSEPAGKKGGGKGKKKAAVLESQDKKDYDEVTCGKLRGATACTDKVQDPIRVTFLQRQSSASDSLQAPYLSAEPVSSPTTVHPVSLSLDVLCAAPEGKQISDVITELVVPAIEKQLHRAVRLAQEHNRGVVAHLFQPPGVAFPVSALYPHARDEGEQLLVDIRTRLHQQLGLPSDRPLLRSANALTFADGRASPAEASTSGRLLDVHVGIKPSGVANGKLSLIHGSYEYYHYMQDRIDDKGWGCAYRSLQTIVSWFRLQNYTTVPVPSHRTIQQTLVDLQDKEPSFVGSSQWIGAIELGYILDTLLGVTCKVLNVNSGAELPSKARELAHHFETQGTPVMIGGGVLAYTLLGIDYNELTGDCAFLILDPHYTGGESLKTIQSGQWIGWKRGGANGIFVQNAFYNLLMPQRPQIV